MASARTVGAPVSGAPTSTTRTTGTTRTNERVVLGMGGCVDHEIAWDAVVLERVAAELGVTTADLGTTAPVRDERDLVVALLTLMAAGSGGERYVADREALRRFAGRFITDVTLGGSSVRAAAVLDRLGVPALLHLVSIDDDVRRLLPASAAYLCSADGDSTDPHAIVQYPAGARVRLADGDVVAPRADRVILVNDPPNADLLLHSGLGDAIAAAGMVVVSGLNTMRDLTSVAERSAQLRTALERCPAGATVVYEDAGFHHDEHRAVVRAVLAGAIDVWSMNADEAQHYLGEPLDLLDAEAVIAAVRRLHMMIGVPTLVVHAAPWSIAHGGPDRGAALRSGVLAATARYAHGDGWTLADRDALAHVPPAPEVATATAAIAALLGDDGAVVATPWTDVANPTTIGLGDTFSGGLVAGLLSAQDDRAPTTGRTR